MSKLSIESMKELARSHGGECLSNEYTNNRTKLRWRCKEGHEWEAPCDHVKGTSKRTGTWCPICGHKRKGQYRKKSLLYLEEIASRFGGKIISDEYLGYMKKHEWECSNGHKFIRTPNDILNYDTFCTKCKLNLGEEICRQVLETAFNTKFIKAKPPWLRNGKGNLMELDGYSEELNLAFEYQGQQHYELGFLEKGSKIKKRKISYESLRNNDYWKMLRCRQNKVTLIQIRFFDKKLIHDKDYVCKHIYTSFENASGFTETIPYFNPEQLNYSRIQSSKRQEFMDYVMNKGGTLLSDYIDQKTKVKIKCSYGHEFSNSPMKIMLYDQWCMTCYKESQKVASFWRAKQIAEQNGGKCLSEQREYRNATSLLSFECRNGHRWDSRASTVIAGHWCKFCHLEVARKIRWDKHRSKQWNTKGLLELSVSIQATTEYTGT